MRSRAVALCGALAVASANGSDWKLPPLDGDLAGDVIAAKSSDGVPLHWKMGVRTEKPRERAVTFSVEGAGVLVRGDARLDPSGNGTWRIIETQIDLSRGAAALTSFFGTSLAGITFSGTTAAGGEGTLLDGMFRGRVQLEVRDAAMQQVAQGWSVEGIAIRGVLGQMPALVSDGSFVLTFKEARFAGAVAHDGVVEFSIDEQQRVHVTRAHAAMFDGHVRVEPFAFALAKPEIEAEVRFDTVEIGKLAALLPPVLSDATGKVSGRMAIRWTAAAGVTPGSGRLQIDPGGAAALRLTPKPGFLTSRMPQRISFLPAWLGPVARAFSPVNPAYETLRQIEMGEMRLEIESLDVGLRPEGDPAGRTAHVVLTAHPANTETVKSVRFEVNVKGPLSDVLRVGLEHGVSVHAR